MAKIVQKREPSHVMVHVDTLKKLADEAGYNLYVKTRGSSGRKWLDPTLVRRDDKGKKHKLTFLED